MTNRVTVPYLNWGRWVADCGCGSAMAVLPGQPSMTCAVPADEDGGDVVVLDGQCGATTGLEWPDVAAVEASVAGLPAAQQSVPTDEPADDDVPAAEPAPGFAPEDPHPLHEPRL